MDHIIFIAFEFPPLQAGGVFRSKEFAKLLPDYGVLPHVYRLSPQHFGNIYPGFRLDEKLTHEVAASKAVVKDVPIDPVWNLYSNGIKRFLNIYFNVYRGNEHKKWRHHLLSMVLKDAEQTPFKAVFVTAPPFGMLPLAAEIAERLELPLIIDMRDAWSFWNSTGFGSYFHYLATLSKERKYFKRADAVIATSDQTISDWRELHPHFAGGKFHCITNGYDRNNVPPISREIIIKPVSHEKEFSIVYVGSFYYSPDARNNMLLPAWKRKRLRKLQYYPRKQDWLYRSPYFFFKALARLFEIDPPLRKLVKVKFAGDEYDWLRKMITEFGLQNEVQLLGRIDHSESLALQRTADALLITSAKVYGGRDCFIAGKTFEYITMNRPVLAFVAEGSQKDLLEKTGLSVGFDPDNTEASAIRLKQILREGLALTPRISFIETF
ncbi:MAG: hypothetical protein EOO01_30130, partial [Chitinophagaceae bacterium]